jgi:hypothetical protein
MSITQLQERHRPLFSTLAPEEAQFVWGHVRKKWGKYLHDPDPTDQPDDGDCLFDLCQSSGLDHARVVLSLANLNGAARPVIEKLIGHPILPWAASVEEKLEARSGAAGRSTGVGARGATTGATGAKDACRARSSTAKADTRVVISVVPQPHKPGTLMYASYACWAAGDTVQTCRDRGVIAMSLRRDVRKGYVKLGAPK